jgi:hypothetical protein
MPVQGSGLHCKFLRKVPRLILREVEGVALNGPCSSPALLTPCCGDPHWSFNQPPMMRRCTNASLSEETRRDFEAPSQQTEPLGPQTRSNNRHISAISEQQVSGQVFAAHIRGSGPSRRGTSRLLLVAETTAPIELRASQVSFVVGRRHIDTLAGRTTGDRQ